MWAGWRFATERRRGWKHRTRTSVSLESVETHFFVTGLHTQGEGLGLLVEYFICKVLSREAREVVHVNLL
jgi:hypothetical protein